MDKASLASRKKLLRAQTEREILQSLDHPFLPTLYTHFETDKFSCLVMEFCPGGDLHTLRQRQPGKHFSEQAVKFYVAEVLLSIEYLHMLESMFGETKQFIKALLDERKEYCPDKPLPDMPSFSVSLHDDLVLKSVDWLPVEDFDIKAT